MLKNSMTGKDLILYILQNNLEDAPIFSDGRFLCFMTVKEAAIKFKVGEATIRTWIKNETLTAIKLGDSDYYIPADAKDPRERFGLGVR